MSTPPHPCEMYAGEQHETDRPAAIGRYHLFWFYADGVTTDSNTIHLCADCLASKIEEFDDIGGSIRELRPDGVVLRTLTNI